MANALPPKPIRALVVDAAGLLHGTRLDAIAERIYSTPLVMREVRDKQARNALSTLHYEGIEVRGPSAEAVKEIAAFATKTGDIAVLSAADLSILALTYDLQKQSPGGIAHLRTTPMMAVAQVGRQQGSGLGANAVQAEGDESAAKVNAETVGNASEHDEDVEEAIRVELEGVSIANEEEDADFANAEEAVEDAEESDEGGWITPTNVRRVKQRHYNGASGDKGEAQTMDVACVTTDFAMQNVLLQMGLILYSLDGLRIQHVKNWVLRCHACYTITKDMTKKFCPQCGNATLIRTSTSLDPATGHVIYHLKRNFQYKLRGTQYSIPPPKGGRDHQRDLILREDQKEYQHALKQSRHVAKKKAAAGTDLFDMDYVPLNGDRKSPHGAFVVIGHGRKNPNEARRKRK